MPSTSHTGRGHHAVAPLESLHAGTYCLYLSCQLGPEHACFPRLSDTKHEFRNRKHGLGHEREVADVAIAGRHRRRTYGDQHSVVLRDRFLDLLESEEIGGSVLSVQNRFHTLWSLLAGASIWATESRFLQESQARPAAAPTSYARHQAGHQAGTPAFSITWP